MNCEWRRGVAEQTGILLGRNAAIHCQSVLAIKSQTEMELWWKPISFVIHKVAMTTNEGCLHRILPSFPEKVSVSVNPSLGPVRGPEARVQLEGPFLRSLMCCLAFLSMKTGWGKSFVVEWRHRALSPPPPLADVFFFQCKSSLISPYKKKKLF